MSFLDRLEARYGRRAVPYVTESLCAGQLLLFVMAQSQPQILQQAQLLPQKVLEGEYWRLISFALVPNTLHHLYFFLGLMGFWFIGTAMDRYWGTLRYNLYLLTGYVVTVGVSFVFPALPATTEFIGTSVFLAFATYFPDVVFRISFILPVKAKWLALLTWCYFGMMFAQGPWAVRLYVLSAVGNYLLFFAPMIYRRSRVSLRHVRSQVQQAAQARAVRHRCHVCGATDRSHPDTGFRYCSQCADTLCYCDEHIRNHDHVSGA